ncbi:MAG: hypothetical protein KAJ33_04125 [Thermoplasmata archaeon]|nr:hypothetical protein [Thermoplasmata archaeon]
MKSKIIGIAVVFVAFAMLSVPVLGTPVGSLTADHDTYRWNKDVTITYEGLPPANYQYEVRIVILNDAEDIVATDPITSGLHVWVWDHVGNYGAYNGSTVDDGFYDITLSYFDNGSLMWLWGGTYDTFELL